MIPLPGSRRARLLLSAAGGGLLSLAFPNTSWLPLLFVALLPLMAAVDRARPRRAALCGAVFGYVFWLGTIPWIAYTVHRYGGVSWAMAVPALLISAGILCVPFALLGLLYGALGVRSRTALLLAWPAAWVVQEGVRIYALSGFPWALLSYPLASTPSQIQLGAFGGALLVSALVVLVNAVLYLAITDRTIRLRLVWLFVAALLLEVNGLAGARRMARIDALTDPSPPLTVAVVQPNVPQESRWDPEREAQILADLVQQTREAVSLSGQKVDLILWPESASPYPWQWSGELQGAVLGLCSGVNAAVLLNTPWSEDPTRRDARFYNTALLVTAGGPVLPPYYKLRLVPFGEYVPLPGLLRRIRPISRAIPASFTPGEEPRLLPLRDRRLGGAVCYEVVYPWVLRDQVRLGADLLYSLTNDAWYGTAGARRQHWQAAVFRAVETGRPLVRAAITGISGLVLPNGLGLPLVGPDVKGSFTVAIARGGLETPFVAWVGDGVLYVCALGLAAAILARLARARRADGRPPRGGRGGTETT